MKALLKIFFTWIAVIFAAWVLPGIHVGGNNLLTPLLVAAVLALLDSFVKPFLIFLTIPITIVTLGLFLLFINVIMVYLTRSVLGKDEFNFDGFWWAFFFGMIVSFVRTLFERMDKKLQKNGEE